MGRWGCPFVLHFAGLGWCRGLRPHPQTPVHRGYPRRSPGCFRGSGGSLMSDRDDSLVVVDEGSAERPLTIPPDLPVLPLRDTVLFPNSFMPLAVAREASVRLIDEAT